MPKVSFSVPIYNVAPFIERNVRSLYEQTMDDIEIVLVDDCTPDNSIDIALKVLEEYPHRKNQVKVVHHEKNMGIAQTKKDCILNCSGDYFIVIDGDDYVDVRMAEKMYNKAIDTYSDMVVCDICEVADSKLKVWNILSNPPEGNGENVRTAMLNRHVTPFMQTRLVRRSIITDNEMIWPKNNLGEDVVICAMYALFSHKISYVNEPLSYYWRHPDSITLRKTDSQLVANFYSFYGNAQILINYLEQKGLAEQYHEGVYRYKYSAKIYALQSRENKKLQKQFIHAFPEINKEMLWGSSSHKVLLRDWATYLFVMCGCFPLLYKFYRVLSKDENAG